MEKVAHKVIQKYQTSIGISNALFLQEAGYSWARDPSSIPVLGLGPGHCRALLRGGSRKPARRGQTFRGGRRRCGGSARGRGGALAPAGHRCAAQGGGGPAPRARRCGPACELGIHEGVPASLPTARLRRGRAPRAPWRPRDYRPRPGRKPRAYRWVPRSRPTRSPHPSCSMNGPKSFPSWTAGSRP